jgi:predicted site-specific integrase-resolvase
MEFVGTKEAMSTLGIKSTTTIMKYESEGIIKVYRPVGNRKRYKVSELHSLQSRG